MTQWKFHCHSYYGCEDNKGGEKHAPPARPSGRKSLFHPGKMGLMLWENWKEPEGTFYSHFEIRAELERKKVEYLNRSSFERECQMGGVDFLTG